MSTVPPGNFVRKLLESAQPVKEQLTSEYRPESKREPLTFVDIVQAFEKNLNQYEGKCETAGKNRADWLDPMNQWIGVPLGSPYCLTGLLFNLRLLEPQFAIKFDIPNIAGTQLFYMACPKEFRSTHPKRGSIGIFRSKADPRFGHAVYCYGEADADGSFETFEFNTNLGGSRDGDGCIKTKRSMAGTKNLELRGFIDLSKCWTER